MVKDRELCRSLRPGEMDDDFSASNREPDYEIVPHIPANKDGVLIINGEPTYEYHGYSDLRVLKIEDNVLIINDNAFGSCTNLERVEMGNGVKFIGNTAFMYSLALETIVWSRSLKYIGIEAFKETGIKELDLPEGLEAIGAAAFSECDYLRVARIPDTVKSIGQAAFSHCENLKEISLPTNPDCTILTKSLFHGCRSLTELILPDSVTEIERDALSGCSSLTKLILPDSVTTIEKNALSGCRSLIELVLPDSVTTIMRFAFLNCEGLRRVSLPRNPNCQFLPRGLVSDARSLKTLIVPENFEFIDAYSLNAENLLALAFMGQEVDFPLSALHTARQEKESELRIVAYRDTPDNKRLLAPRLVRLPKLQIKGLIQDDGSVKWYRNGALMKNGVTKADISRLFPEKRDSVLNAMAAATRYTQRDNWPVLDELANNIFPELNDLLRFVESFNRSGRVVNMLSPGSWLGETI